MLKAVSHKDFKKDFKKLSKKVRDRFSERLIFFLKDPANPQLQDHPLKGNMLGKRSFSITGDIRAVYRYLEKDVILLLEIGTHNQVY